MKFWVVKVASWYCRFGSYGSYERVDSPFRATPYRRKSDAEKRPGRAVEIEVLEWLEDGVPRSSCESGEKPLVTNRGMNREGNRVAPVSDPAAGAEAGHGSGKAREEDVDWNDVDWPVD